MDKKNLEYFLVLGGPALITLGIIKLSFYYSFFNIEILHFMELSEVLGAFITDLVIYIVLGSFTFLLSYVFLKKGDKFKYNRFLLKYYKSDELENRIQLLSKQHILIIITTLILLILTIIFNYNDNYFYTATLCMLIMIIFQLLFITTNLEIKRNYWLKNKLLKRNEKWDIFVGVLYRLIYLVIIWTGIEVQRVKHESRYINTEIDFGSTIFKSDSINFYIGHTNNYIFLYDKELDVTTVRKMSEVKEIKFGDIYYMFHEQEKYTSKDTTIINPTITDSISQKTNNIVGKNDFNDTLQNENTITSPTTEIIPE